MAAPVLPNGRLTTRLRPAVVCPVVGLVLALSGTLLTPAGAAEVASERRGPATATSDVTMVQANIRSDLSVDQFQSDVREVLAVRPDFVTYNEVPLRNELVFAPDGYEVWRSDRNRYTRSTAVVWREDRWTQTARGVFRISNWRGVPDGKRIELGRRFANWVTLIAPDGRTVSVVAVHIAPLTKGMPDLRRESVKRLTMLVGELDDSGPVLVGGDFNMHYMSAAYPYDLFSRASMSPTYETLGTTFATGDHQGATIDYLFHNGPQILPDSHYPIELNSDHDAVVAGMSWQVDAPAETQTLRNDPAGDRLAQWAAITTVLESIRAAEPGAKVEVVTSDVGIRAVLRRLKQSLARGVHVRLTTRSSDLTSKERRLARAIAASGDPESWVRQCDQDCRAVWWGEGGARTMVMVSGPEGRWQVRADVDRILDRSAVEKQTEVKLRTGEFGLAEGARLLDAIRF